ncbi:MAG: hypothetical protein WDN69_32240 [Aliidongia sp.]
MLFASVLPGSRSVQLSNTATVFASMINSGTTDLSNCQVSLPASAPAGLTMNYQSTNPATNALTGTPNTPVTITGNDGLATFVLSFKGATPFSAPRHAARFRLHRHRRRHRPRRRHDRPGDLQHADRRHHRVGGTPTNNGVIEVPTNGAAAFAVASFNVGITESVVVSVDTGSATLPLALSICESDPSNGQCLAPPGTLGLFELCRRCRADLLDLRDRCDRLLAGHCAHLRPVQGRGWRPARLDQRRSREPVTPRMSKRSPARSGDRVLWAG